MAAFVSASQVPWYTKTPVVAASIAVCIWAPVAKLAETPLTAAVIPVITGLVELADTVIRSVFADVAPVTVPCGTLNEVVNVPESCCVSVRVTVDVPESDIPVMWLS